MVGGHANKTRRKMKQNKQNHLSHNGQVQTEQYYSDQYMKQTIYD